MTQIQKTLIWAAVIIIAAVVANEARLSDSASFGIIAGLTGAAAGVTSSNRKSCRGCS